MMNMNTNPFLTFAVEQACNQSRVSYLDTLARMQQRRAPAVEQLEAACTQHEINLDNYWSVARKLAFSGQTERASNLIAILVVEWGVYKGLSDVIDARQRRRYLDPADPDTANDIQLALSHEVALLSAQLLSEQLAGVEQRAAEQSKQQQDWQREAFQHQADWHGVTLRAFQEVRTGWQQAQATNQEYARTALETFQELRAGWQTAQATNQEYARTALDGVYQAQQSALHLNSNAQALFNYSTQTQQSAIGMQQALQYNLEQRLPEYVEEATYRAERRRGMTKAIVVAVFIIGIPVALVLAYVILMAALR